MYSNNVYGQKYVPKAREAKNYYDAPHELGFSVEGNEHKTKPYAGPLGLNQSNGFGKRTQNA